MLRKDKPGHAWAHSLRFRLTAWYTGAFGLALILASSLLYLGAQHALRTETDAFLKVEAQRLASEAVGKPDDPPEAADLAEAVSSSNLSADARGNDPIDILYVRLVSRDTGRTVTISPDLARQPPLITSLDALVKPGSALLSPRFAFAGPDEERTMRVLTEPLQIGPRSLMLQLAVPWDHNADLLERLGLLLGLAVPAVLLAAAFGGWVLVGRTLQPIRRIVAEAENLDANALPEKLLPAATETDSEIGQLVATLNHMTSRLRQSFESQRHFAEAQQRFAADASHELRTPLTILRGEMELALARPRLPGDYRATLASSVEEIDRMTAIVEGLSFLARSDAKQMEAGQSESVVNLSALVHKVVADFETQARERRIALSYQIDEVAPPVFVSGHDVPLQQLVGNLVDNALKFTPSDGSITVALARDAGEDCCLLTVRDTGRGIAPEDLPRVFERFWRADPARQSGGSGLGLAICAQIVQIHRGQISLESEPDHGTVFRVSLPCRNAQE